VSEGVRVVLVTAPDAAVADKLARGLVERKLAACVNVLAGVVSHYYWEGALQKDSECLLVVKTRQARLAELAEWVRANHPASLPEIVALPVEGGDPRYLEWVVSSTR
jgi:periplasmic divalent cation tolerance protein